MYIIKKNKQKLFSSCFKPFSSGDISDYFVNFAKSIQKDKVENVKLQPIKEANHDLKNFKCQLFSIPFKEVDKDSTNVETFVSKYVPDVVFFQYDPMVYLHRQRIFSYKCYLEETGESHQSYQIKGLDIPHPFSIREIMINPIVLDMSHSANSNMKLELDKGFVNYHQKVYDNQEIHDNFSNMLVNSISKFIFNNNFSPFQSINHLIYQAILSKQNVVLGDMPELLLRLYLGNTVMISEARDIFKSVLVLIDKHKGKLPVKDITFLYFSHIFLLPKNIYMTGVLNQLMKEVDSVIAFLGSPHFEQIQNLWGQKISFESVLQVPDRIVSEKENDLIEKQAIFDVLMDSRLWSESYIVNPFIYLEKDASKFTEEDYGKHKAEFKKYLDKYERLKMKSYEKYENLLKYEQDRKSIQTEHEFRFENLKNKI